MIYLWNLLFPLLGMAHLEKEKRNNRAQFIEYGKRLFFSEKRKDAWFVCNLRFFIAKLSWIWWHLFFQESFVSLAEGSGYLFLTWCLIADRAISVFYSITTKVNKIILLKFLRMLPQREGHCYSYLGFKHVRVPSGLCSFLLISSSCHYQQNVQT